MGSDCGRSSRDAGIYLTAITYLGLLGQRSILFIVVYRARYRDDYAAAC